jgi:hypothetical protein
MSEQHEDIRTHQAKLTDELGTEGAKWMDRALRCELEHRSCAGAMDTIARQADAERDKAMIENRRLSDNLIQSRCNNRHLKARVAVLVKRGTVTDAEMTSEIRDLNLEEEQCGCFRDPEIVHLQMLLDDSRKERALADIAHNRTVASLNDKTRRLLEAVAVNLDLRSQLADRSKNDMTDWENEADATKEKTKNDKDTGGPAFPGGQYTDGNRDDGTPVVLPRYAGMTLRDYFAGQALAGLRARETDSELPMVSSEQTAIFAYEDADAMLKEREKTNGKH